MMILIVVVLGIISLTRMGLDLMPDITFPLVTVIASYEGVSPEDMETLVTRPIERAGASAQGASQTNAFTMEGISGVIIEFEWGTDIDRAAEDIRNHLEMIRYMLPADMDTPQVMRFDPGMMPIAGYGVSADIDPLEMARVMEDEVEPAIEQIDGVAAVYTWGTREREIRVELLPEKMKAYRISAGQVAAAVSAGSPSMPGGRVEEGFREYTLRLTGEYTSVEDIENTAVGFTESGPVFLRDIARVRDTVKEQRALSRINGKEGPIFMAMAESEANPVLVARRIASEVEELKRRLPADIRITSFLDIGEMITRILYVALTTAVTGGLLAVLILFFFLRSVRATLVIAVAIPLAGLATFLPLHAAGFNINFVILIGIALGVGMMVDNAIVVIENAYRHLEITKDPVISSSIGAKEVGMAITASTFTTVAVFLPLLFTRGIVGRIFSQLALTVGSALICSLLVALTMIPMLTSKLMKKESALKKVGWLETLREHYSTSLTYALDHKGRVMITAALIIAAAVAMFPFMSKEYFPTMDQAIMLMEVEGPVGTTLEESSRAAARLEELLEIDEVLSYASFVGMVEGGEIDAAMGTGPSGPHEGSVYINLKDRRDRQRTQEEIVREIQRRLPPLETFEIRTFDVGRAMIAAGGAQEQPLQIDIFGPDLDTLESISGRILEILREIEGIHGVTSTIEEGRPEMVIRVDRKKTAELGIPLGEAASEINTLASGRVAARFREAGREYDINVILEEGSRDNFQKIANLPVFTPDGRDISLIQFASMEEAEGPARLIRENRRRKVMVGADYEGMSLSEAVSAVERGIRQVEVPLGYSIDFGGEAEDMQDMFITLMQLFALALLLVYMVMASQFESFIHPLILMVSIPLAYVGAIILLSLTGTTISMPSAMGGLILFGIIVNNAIVLIDYVNQLRRDRGMGLREAVVEGGKTRLRPILMTATTTTIAMVPVALNRMEGFEIRTSVAQAIIGGLIAGTLLTLFVIPVVYEYIESRREKKLSSG